jgi:diguanylate cyclase (GGDEF)-like protein
MSPESGAPSLVGRHVFTESAADATRSFVDDVAAQRSLHEAARVLSTGLASIVDAPLAVLSKGAGAWQFEAEAFPAEGEPGPLARPPLQPGSDPVQHWQMVSGKPWTGITLGQAGGREWMLLAPGTTETWAARPHFHDLVEQLGWSLEQVASKEHDEYVRRFGRRLHAFSHRLAREDDGKLHPIVLRTLAQQTRARTGALAVFNESEQALEIVATVGYPMALVEHLRIAPGEGVLGRAYQGGRAAIVRGEDLSGHRRLRYRTNSYMVLPITAGDRRMAVVALTDRADEREFDERDFNAARLLATVSAPALMRERVSQNFGALTRMATVDPVSGLFNRRYFESRIAAEVERSRRQQQDLALLMIDIDEFKRINDRQGHLEGDRTLHDVADLLRQSVRIFDVCARFGGDEFAIVMPGASAPVAIQVAERIRGRVERHFGHVTPRVTVSVGVGILETDEGSQELIEVADRALMAAKVAGKNMVWVDSQSRNRVRPSP